MIIMNLEEFRRILLLEFHSSLCAVLISVTQINMLRTIVVTTV